MMSATAGRRRALDGLGELLPARRRAVEVDHRHDVAGRGEQLRVPAEWNWSPKAPCGPPWMSWTSGHFLAASKPGRQDDEDLHGFAARALELDLLHLAERDLGERRGGEA